jgi:hypothetical protein
VKWARNRRNSTGQCRSAANVLVASGCEASTSTKSATLLIYLGEHAHVQAAEVVFDGVHVPVKARLCCPA